MNAMMKGGGLTKEDLFKKFLCFGIDEVNVFQHGKNKCYQTNQDSWAPFSMGSIVLLIELT
jgi:hypothetical protein